MLGIVLAVAAAGASAEVHIERIEPPNWWVGMRHSELQLVIEGPGVGGLQSAVHRRGVKLLEIQRGDSPDYLFLKLRIAQETLPGDLQIDFLRLGRVVTSQPYALLRREPSSAAVKCSDSDTFCSARFPL